MQEPTAPPSPPSLDSDKARVFVSETPLSLEEALAFVDDPAHGAILPFLGVVRNHNLGRPVSGVSYDVYEPLASRTMGTIAAEAFAASPLPLKLWFAHYQGFCAIGQASVLIAASCAARAPAFDATRYCIEELKKRVPIWKQEHYEDGPAEWLPGFSLGEGQAKPP